MSILIVFIVLHNIIDSKTKYIAKYWSKQGERKSEREENSERKVPWKNYVDRLLSFVVYWP